MTAAARPAHPELPPEVPEGHKRLSNRTISAISNALTLLSQRQLPGAKVERRVARLVRQFKPLAQDITDADNKTKIRYTKEDPETGETSFINTAALSVEVNELYSELQDVPDLNIRLTAEDMPKEAKDTHSSKSGALAENRVSLAAIKADLDFLYDLDGEKDE